LNHHDVAGSTPSLVTIGRRYFGVHKLASGVNVPRRCGTASWEPALPDSLIGGLGLDRNNPEDFRRHLPEEDTDVETVTVGENRRSAIQR
jgi:hypothetical protein